MRIRHLLLTALMFAATAGVSTSTAFAQYRPEIELRFGPGYDYRYDYGYGVPSYRLSRGQYQELRRQARDLDRLMQRITAQAELLARRGTQAETYFLFPIRDLGLQVQSFYARLTDYQLSPQEISREVRRMDLRSRRIGARLREARVFERLYDDWNEAHGIINQMKRILGDYGQRYPRYWDRGSPGYRTPPYPGTRPPEPYYPGSPYEPYRY